MVPAHIKREVKLLNTSRGALGGSTLGDEPTRSVVLSSFRASEKTRETLDIGRSVGCVHDGWIQLQVCRHPAVPKLTGCLWRALGVRHKRINMHETKFGCLAPTYSRTASPM